MTHPGFEALAERRRRLRDASADNDIDMARFLSDFYPDRAHFVYELLANAEDAQSRRVDFELTDHRLVVRHDGTDLFSLEDVTAITGLANSTKSEDSEKIGKFGVGFKAVYEYSRRPEIRSGEFSFAIEDVWVPVPVDGAAPSGTTEFTFPFDHPVKPGAVAAEEVEAALRALGPTALLFLRSIDTIGIRFPDGSTGLLHREAAPDNTITVSSGEGSDRVQSRWLLIQRAVALEGAVSQELTIAAAFGVEDRSRGRAQGVRVRPLDVGDTCVYFPAAKETSGLKFHIHAPFAVTPARDSLKDGEFNDELAVAVGDLIADALPGWANEGLLDDGLLAALPNNDDPLDARYTAMKDRILAAFAEHEITPVHGEGVARSTELRDGPTDLRRVLNPESLNLLVGIAGDGEEPASRVRWLAGRTGRAQRLLSSLGVEPFGWDDFQSIVDDVRTAAMYTWWPERQRLAAAWKRWLESLDDPGFGALIEAVGAARARSVFKGSLSGVPFVRERTKTGTRIVAGTKTHLPTTAKDVGIGRVPVALSYFDDDEPTARKSALENFYAATGTRRWDQRARVQKRLARYREHRVALDDDKHYADLVAFIKHVDANPADRKLFESVPVFRAVNDADDDGPTEQWATGSQTYLDTPYTNTGFRATHVDTALRLSPEYEGRVEGIEGFARALGAVSTLKLARSNPRYNSQFSYSWTSDGRETEMGSRWDWDLKEFEAIIASGDSNVLHALWRLASTAKDDHASAVYQANSRTSFHRMDSTIAQRMTTTPWVLGRDGTLHLARELAAPDLPDGWTPPPAGSLAVSVGFGEIAAKSRERAAQQQALAESIGVEPDELAEFAALTPEMRRALLETSRVRPAVFPGAASEDPERRASRVEDRAADAPNFSPERRERSIDPEAADIRKRARAYLEAMYVDAAGDMFCQLCHERMPFRFRGGWYFEVAELVRDRRSRHWQNYLALCPLCTALYRHVRETSDDALLSDIASMSIEESVENVDLPVGINGRRISIRFTGTHAIDIRAVLGVAGENRE